MCGPVGSSKNSSRELPVLRLVSAPSSLRHRSPCQENSGILGSLDGYFADRFKASLIEGAPAAESAARGSGTFLWTKRTPWWGWPKIEGVEILGSLPG